VGVRVGVAYSRRKLAMRTKMGNLNLKTNYLSLIASEISAFISAIFRSLWFCKSARGKTFFKSIDRY